MKRILLFVGAGLAALIIVVGVGGGTAYLVLKGLGTPVAAPASEGGAIDVELTKENVLPLKPFVTNLTSDQPGRPQYISVTFELVLRKAEEKTKVEENLPLIRDAIVSVLSTKKSQEVTGEAGANTLKNDVLARINKELGTKAIQKVLITDLAVQY